MSDYKRLTKRFRNSQMQPDIELMSTVADGIERLAKYEDDEESGLLKRLPCKEGTPIYYIQKQCEKGRYNSLKKFEKDCEYYEPDYYDVEERCVLDIEDDEEYKHYCSQNLKIFCNLCKERLVVCKDVFTLSKINQIYGTAQYNPSTKLEDTYFLTVEGAEEKIEELKNGKL